MSYACFSHRLPCFTLPQTRPAKQPFPVPQGERKNDLCAIHLVITFDDKEYACQILPQASCSVNMAPFGPSPCDTLKGSKKLSNLKEGRNNQSSIIFCSMGFVGTTHSAIRLPCAKPARQGNFVSC